MGRTSRLNSIVCVSSPWRGENATKNMRQANKDVRWAIGLATMVPFIGQMSKVGEVSGGATFGKGYPNYSSRPAAIHLENRQYLPFCRRSVGLRPALRRSECKVVWVFDAHEFDRNTYSAGRRPTLRSTLAGRRPTLRCVYHPRAFTAADAD